MAKRFLLCLLIIFSATAVTAAIHVQLGNIRAARPVAAPPADRPPLAVVLVPLDSRPPCTQFVDQLARLAGAKIIMPPPELLDHYRTPADKAGMRAWLRESVKGAHAAIVSTDMLMHGGLLASRLASGTPADAEATLALLSELHRDNPQLKIYAFSIIPRLLIADGAAGSRIQKNMLKYSVLKDEVLTFENPLDRDKLEGLAGEIPTEIINQYLALYEANTQINFRLLAMAEKGMLAGLVFGQDDGYPFGMPNMVKVRLSHYVQHRPELSDKVFITRGTDEVALTLLSRLQAEETGYRPRVSVRYSHPDAAGTVMPFMPHSVARTVSEKIGLIGGREICDAERADFVLYVHIGTAKMNRNVLTAAAREVRRLVDEGHQVAVVDLTEDFFAQETLLPHMLRADVDLTRLAAYAGWNTTSNSVGTAVTQAALYTGTLALRGPEAASLALYQSQLEFLTARMLDDWYFQKDVQPFVNRRLKAQKLDPYNLGDSFQRVNDWIATLMNDRGRVFVRQALAGRTKTIQVDGAARDVVVTDLQLECRLPWQRTFEVWLQPRLSFGTVEKIR